MEVKKVQIGKPLIVMAFAIVLILGGFYVVSRLGRDNSKSGTTATTTTTTIAPTTTTQQALETIRASHILVETEEEAQDMVAQLKDGADFAELAREYSSCPSSVRGGDLGEFPRGMMVQPFEDAAFSLDVGEVSGPVQTQYGWHVILRTMRSIMAA